jgi:hypothetical protein
MPAILLHGDALPLTVPPLDARIGRRQIPEELRVFERDESPIGLAIRALTKEIFRPPIGLLDREEVFKNQTAAAVNQLAEAAFTPMTSISYLGADENVFSPSFSNLDGLEQNITVPVPARAHLLCVLVARCDTDNNEFLLLQILNGSTVIAESEVRVPVADDPLFQWPVVLQAVIDLEPGQVYNFAVEAGLSNAGPDYEILAGNNDNFSSLTVRVEPRSLVTE